MGINAMRTRKIANRKELQNQGKNVEKKKKPAEGVRQTPDTSLISLSDITGPGKPPFHAPAGRSVRTEAQRSFEMRPAAVEGPVRALHCRRRGNFCAGRERCPAHRLPYLAASPAVWTSRAQVSSNKWLILWGHRPRSLRPYVYRLLFTLFTFSDEKDLLRSCMCMYS